MKSSFAQASHVKCSVFGGHADSPSLLLLCRGEGRTLVVGVLLFFWQTVVCFDHLKGNVFPKHLSCLLWAFSWSGSASSKERNILMVNAVVVFVFLC